MADIEERAAAWVRENFSAEYLAHQDEGFEEALIDAYLAGAGQAASDYSQHYNRPGLL